MELVCCVKRVYKCGMGVLVCEDVYKCGVGVLCEEGLQVFRGCTALERMCWRGCNGFGIVRSGCMGACVVGGLVRKVVLPVCLVGVLFI